MSSQMKLAPAPGPNVAAFVVGNTYQKLADSKAKLNRKGTLKKIHDWVLYVDVVQGDHHLIESVQFEMDKSWQPRNYTCKYPVKVTLPDGSRVMRFQTRQQSTGSIIAKVKIAGCGVGGTIVQRDHPISLKPRGLRKPPEHFVVTKSIAKNTNALEPNKLANENFGIELELSCAQGSSVEQVAGVIRSGSRVAVTVVQGYARVHDPVVGWKLVHDGSIVCSPTFPNCSKFELVSPILRGEVGLAEVSRVIRSLQGVAVSVNKSMGFHLHISVKDMPTHSLKKVCQNFVKYEDVIDTFMLPSRRTGSEQSNQYFKSNKQEVGGATNVTSNLQRNQNLARCTSTAELCEMMNPSGRYYKLNLQNLVTRRQPTIEFRQHSATSNFEKIAAWVRFCMALVKNSARFKEPSALKNTRSLEEQFEMLFDFVIKDRALRKTFLGRQTAVLREDAGCCNGCVHGRPCAVGSLRRPQITF